MIITSYWCKKYVKVGQYRLGQWSVNSSNSTRIHMIGSDYFPGNTITTFHDIVHSMFHDIVHSMFHDMVVK